MSESEFGPRDDNDTTPYAWRYNRHADAETTERWLGAEYITPPWTEMAWRLFEGHLAILSTPWDSGCYDQEADYLTGEYCFCPSCGGSHDEPHEKWQPCLILQSLRACGIAD